MTRPMIARMTVQNWKNTSQVMYIGITSLCARKANKKRFTLPRNPGSQPPPCGTPTGASAPLIFYHKSLALSSDFFFCRSVTGILGVWGQKFTFCKD